MIQEHAGNPRVSKREEREEREERECVNRMTKLMIGTKGQKRWPYQDMYRDTLTVSKILCA